MAAFPFHYFLALRDDYVRMAEMATKAVADKAETENIEVDVGM